MSERDFSVSHPLDRTDDRNRFEIAAASKRRKMTEDEEIDQPAEICRICNQNVLDPKTKSFGGLPEGALEEEAALTDDRLQLHRDGGFVPEEDGKPFHKLTLFAVFDGEGHLCPFDTGLIERDRPIFFSGYIKPIYEDDPSPENGIPAGELGPIIEWWISGYDGGNSFLIALRSPCAEYLLMEPSPEYGPFMRIPKQKALLTKIAIEFLSEAENRRATYEDLLGRISEVSVPGDIEPFDGESLARHARFVIDQIREVDTGRRMESIPAVREMMKRFGLVDAGRRGVGQRKRSRLFYGDAFRGKAITPLVRSHFKFFLDGEDSPGSPARDSGIEPEVTKISTEIRSGDTRKVSRFSWQEKADFAVVNGRVVSRRDFVSVRVGRPEKENRIFRIERFFRRNFTDQIHCTEFVRGTETVLGKASDPGEIFRVEEECSDWPICKIRERIGVQIWRKPKNWEDFLNHRLAEPPEGEYFLRKKYSIVHGAFEDLEEEEDDDDYDDDDDEKGSCPVCKRREEAERAKAIVPVGGKPDDSGATIHERLIRGGEEYLPGTCVLLEPFSVVFDAQKSSRRIEKTLVTLKADESVYPEIYRKSKEIVQIGDRPDPFAIGRVKKIFSKTDRDGSGKRNFFLTVNKFYRPENTRILESGDERLLDLQLLYWSEEEEDVSLEHVRGTCEVIRSDIPPREGSEKAFYFSEGFDSKREIFYRVEEEEAEGKVAEEEVAAILRREKKRFPAAGKKLKTLNAFAGCGGLAEGLRQSGAAEIAWAVEMDEPTSKSFKLNFPEAVVFQEDCNSFLRKILSERPDRTGANRYPRRGEVEFLCGGPPCQGFSIMNRFGSREESRYNNSLLLTLLSLCDYYRPKFFLLENVRNLVSYRKSAFLRHALACLVAMGYQCSFAVLQAGNYGLPQTRRRLFVLAASPGHRLPQFPRPTNVFEGSARDFGIEVSGRNFTCRFPEFVSGSAPFRQVTIRDAIRDLPPIRRGGNRSGERSPPPVRTYYQRSIGSRSPCRIRDHVTKEPSPIDEARFRHVPAAKGCDWRDLPNIRVRLRDGTSTDLLRYSHHDRKNGKSRSGLMRGVCGCASGLPCDSRDRQGNTLIPWYLVHTANRNNNWSGSYGRLDWQGVFSTVTTNPEPSNQQGKVLHPEEDRVVTVRESARAQGMPDSFRFFGTIGERFRQVGNAVPPPVSREIGFEIRKCLPSD